MRKPKTNTSGESEFQGAKQKLPEEPRTENPLPIENQARRAIELGGSILAKKHMETLEALLKAYDARLKSSETLEQRWENTPIQRRKPDN